MGVIGTIFSQIFSVALPEGAAWIKEQRDQEGRLEQAQKNVEQILLSEQSNWYYDDLTRVLVNSTVLRDVVKGCLTGTPVPNIDNRINDLLVHERVQESNRSQVKSIINKIIVSIRNALIDPAEGAEARSAYRINELEAKIDGFSEQVQSIGASLSQHQSNELSLYEIENYCEQLMDVSHMITRKLIATDSNSTEETRLSWTDILQTQKRIAIVNDAGVGKTYALHQLCRAAKSQGYCSAYLTLNKYPGIPLFEDLLKKHLPDSSKVVLILDGYDEIKPEYVPQFVTVLNSIDNKYPDMTIVLSSRSNFFVHHRLQYELFRLAEVTAQERLEYIQERSIDSHAFFEQVRERKLEEVCNNIFYFIELVHLWQEESTLPDEADIMKAIIDSRIRADREKYKLSIPELSEYTASLRNLFERIAFIMQCTHRQQLTEKEMEQICSQDERERLKLHGLWEDDSSGNWTFAHNNFREYFAACWLRRQSWEQIERYISWAPKTKKVKPSWMNVLAYMAKMKNSRDLQDWIAQYDPTIVTLFEKEKFSEEERFSIFKRIYDQHEEDLTWADVDYDACKRMGAFASCGKAVEYILEKLSKKLHLRQEKNLLRVMAFFENLYGHEEDCKLVISSIAFDDDYPEHTRSDALDVMRKFPQVFIEYVQTAVEKNLKSNSIDYRYHLQQFIEATGKLDDHFEIIIHELQQAEKEDDAYNISRKLFLEQLCSTINSNDNVLRLFSYACEHPECIDESPFDEAWENLFNVAIHCDEANRDKFLQAVLQLFSATHHRYYSGIDSFIKEFMVSTGNEKAFFESILSYEDFEISYAIRSLACPSLIDLLISYYNADRLTNSKLPEQVIQHLPSTDPLHGELLKAVYLKTGVELSVPAVVDNGELRRKGEQIYFDSLFSKPMFTTLVAGLCELLGRETPVKAKSHVVCDPLDQKTALIRCLYALRSVASDDKKITLGTVMDHIKDWDWFRYYCACHALQRNKEITIDIEQKRWMEDYTRSILSGMDTAEIRKDFYEKHCYNPVISLALSTAVRLDMAFPSEVFCSFVLIPSFLFGESNPTTLPQYVLDHIPEDELERLVMHNIQHENLKEDMAATHLRYCTEHKLLGAKEFAKTFLSKDESEGYRYSALNYISQMYGDSIIVDEVVPLRDDERFLQDIVYHLPLCISSSLLDAKLESVLEKNPASHLREVMIKRNHRGALTMYYEQAQNLQTLPDMTEGSMIPALTEAIRSVNDIEVIDIIIGLFRLSNQTNFVDKTSLGLRSACWDSLKNMASVHYDEVKTILTKEKSEASGNHLLSCIDLLQRIDEINQYNIDKGISFELALALTTN